MAGGVREIPLGRSGKVALIDEADWPLVSPFRWSALGTKYVTYAVSSRKDEGGVDRFVSMHRLLLGAQKGQWVDHKNGDGLDNRRENIRLCTPSQNAMNRPRLRGAVRYRGVQKLPDGTFSAAIRADGLGYLLGAFPTPEEAARAYDAACRLLHGEFGHLNFPGEPAVELGPVQVGSRWREADPKIAHLVVPSAHELSRARRLQELAQYRATDARVRLENERVIPLMPPRLQEVCRAYSWSRNMSKAGEALGLSRERVRQLIGRAAGFGFKDPHGAPRRQELHYTEDYRRFIGRLAAEEGVFAVAKISGIAETNVRTWKFAHGSVDLGKAGRLTLEEAARRDRRIRSALAQYALPRAA